MAGNRTGKDSGSSEEQSPPRSAARSNNRARDANLLRHIAAGLAPPGSQDFFPSLVKYLCLDLDVNYAVVGELDGADLTARTLAVWADGKIADNFQYHLADTPCQNVIGKGPCVHARDVRRLFPRDRYLADWKVESYAGAPLFGAGGRVLGLLAVMSRRPLRNQRKAMQLLQILAVSAAAELERGRAERALNEAHGRFEAIIENAPLLAVQGYDAEGRVVFWNKASENLYGFKSADMLGKRLGGSMLAPEDALEFERLARDALARGAAAPAREWATKTAAGETRWIMSSMFPIGHGDQALVVCMDMDISVCKASEEESRKLTSAVQQTADSVVITDRAGVIEYVNQAFEDMTGYPRGEALGAKLDILKSGMHDADFYRRLWASIIAGETFRDVFINRRKNGDVYYEEKTITPLKDDQGRITHFIATGKDITERMQAHERLHYLAHHDALTGLPNRVLVMDRLEQALIRAHLHQRLVGVMFLDLDRFKNINDTLGHDIGDRFLKVMAERLRRSVHEGDTVARLGGDEFAILFEDVQHAEELPVVASRILGVFAEPFALDGREFYITASIGISIYPNDGVDAPTLLKNADAAMYRAKGQGRNNYQFCSSGMGGQAFKRLTLDAGLRHALERGEFVLHYQPQVDAKSGRICGMEALVRWRHPELGMIPPLQFIALADETGLIIPIGEWILGVADAQAREWRAQGIGPAHMAINISARQFNEPVFVDGVRRLTQGLAPEAGLMELEIAEGVIMKDAETTADRLRALQDMGLRFAIDDFGTGYSSLSQLRRLPIHTLKIDHSFIRDVTTDQEGAEIVKTIIAMAHGLKLRVVAEGVETAEQAAFLRSHGCDTMQGYFYSHPLPADEATRLLREERRL